MKNNRPPASFVKNKLMRNKESTLAALTGA